MRCFLEGYSSWSRGSVKGDLKGSLVQDSGLMGLGFWGLGCNGARFRESLGWMVLGLGNVGFRDWRCWFGLRDLRI